MTLIKQIQQLGGRVTFKGNAGLQKEPPQQAALDEESNENLKEAQGEAKEEQGHMATMNFEVTDIQANRSCRRL